MSTSYIKSAGMCAILALSILACSKKDSSAEKAEPAGGAITVWTDSTELFMEHPALIVGAPDKFAVHLTDLTDFAPLRSGKITLRFLPRDGGEPVVVVQDAPRSPGIYGPSPEFRRAGVYDLALIVRSPQASDSITVRDLRVFPNAEAAPKEEGGDDAGIAFLKEQQWKTVGFRTEFAKQGSVLQSFDVSGQVVPAGGRFAEVAAPISGLVDASSVSISPAPGQQVRRGQTIAFIMPSLGEGGAVYPEARARLREAQDEYERARRLFAVEAVPQRRVHEAEIRLQAAREALAGLGGASGRVAVRSPINGVVTARTISPGTRVDAGSSLFTIVDPSVVWVRANVPAAQAPFIGQFSRGSFQIEGSPRTYQAERMVSAGSVIDETSRTVPVIYQVSNRDGSIRVGSNARVFVGTGRQVTGVVIRESAVLDESGKAIVYVQPEGERFEKREVTLGGKEAGRVLITSGVNEGERVVSGAAYQVRLASLSTAVPAHGHEH
jgi:membrane fusion protein, heavy metal efflux system